MYRNVEMDPLFLVKSNGKKTLHRCISGDALWKLLLSSSARCNENDGEYAMDDALWNGYSLVEQAHAYFKKKQYQDAIPLYKEGIAMALEPAHALVDSCNVQKDTLPRQFVWLVQAYCQQAQAKLQVNDKEGALVSARAACDLSKNTNAQSLDILATACQAVHDASGELQALKAYLDLPQNDNMPRDEANRRRSLGFRLQTLEREAACS